MYHLPVYDMTGRQVAKEAIDLIPSLWQEGPEGHIIYAHYVGQDHLSGPARLRETPFDRATSCVDLVVVNSGVLPTHLSAPFARRLDDLGQFEAIQILYKRIADITEDARYGERPPFMPESYVQRQTQGRIDKHMSVINQQWGLLWGCVPWHTSE